MRNSSKLFVAVAAAGLVVAGGSAFTASNTMADAGDAGSVTTAVSGFTVSNVSYTANPTTPTDLDSVSFTLNNAAAFVAIETHAAGQWFKSDDARVDADGGGPGTVMVDSCTSADAGISWVCDVTGAAPNETVAAATDLTVVATN